MIQDIDAIHRFRCFRVAETFEDLLVLLRFRFPLIFNKNHLAGAAEQFRLASADARRKLFRDPKVCLWSLIDPSPLAEESSSTEFSQLAEELAEQINLMALGVAHLDGRIFSASFEKMSQGSSIPGTGISLEFPTDYSGMIEITTQADTSFLIDGAPAIRREWRSTMGFSLPIGDHLLVPPPLDDYEMSPLDPEEAKQWDQLLMRIAPMLKACPQSDMLVSMFGSYIVPLKPSPNGNHLSVSFKHRPGIIYASWSENDLDVLEALVHEADHQCLFEVINEDALLTDAEVNFRPCFRSPWRTDPRPLSGLLFGLSAFVSVGVFWSELIAKSVIRHESIGCRAVLSLDQSLDAISIVRNSAKLTARGMSLLEFNRLTALKALNELMKHPSFDAWRAESNERCRADASFWSQAYGAENVLSEMTRYS